MMNRAAAILISLGILLLSGCAGSPVKEESNATKAAELNAQMGLRYMMQGNYERSLEKLKHALTFEPDYGPAHHYLGELYKRLGRQKEAESHFRKAVRARPGDSALQNNFGVFLCSIEKYEEAEKSFLKVLDDPVYRDRAAVYENLGLCLKRKGDGEKAEAYLRRALTLNPKLSKSLYGMAELSFQKRNLYSARAYLQRYLEGARHTPETLWLGIQVERVLGDEDALASYTLLLKNGFPNSEQARLLQNSER